MNKRIVGLVIVMATFGLWIVLETSGSRSLNAQQPQTGGVPAIDIRVAALEALVASLQQTNSNHTVAIAALNQRLTQAEGKLAFVTVQGTEMYITGANLHIRNGLGATNGNPALPDSTIPAENFVNRLGNLIIGYNGGSGLELRGGSHNLVLGDRNHYSFYAGIAAGWDNSSGGPYASTLGGRSNRAHEKFSTIVGGAFNLTDGHTAAILGGNANRASNIDSTVGGGNQNWANARFATVGGGSNIIQATEFGWSAGSFGAAVQGSFRSP